MFKSAVAYGNPLVFEVSFDLKDVRYHGLHVNSPDFFVYLLELLKGDRSFWHVLLVELKEPLKVGVIAYVVDNLTDYEPVVQRLQSFLLIRQLVGCGEQGDQGHLLWRGVVVEYALVDDRQDGVEDG